MTPGKENIAGCILAGGLSRRMGGRDKPLIPLGGRPMIAHVGERLAPQVSCSIINANGDPARYAGLGMPVVPDRIRGHAGPLAGLSAGLSWCRENRLEITHLATAAADTPFFPRDLVERLARKAGDGSIVLAASDGRHHPVFGLWPVSLAKDLEAWMEETDHYKVMSWVRRHVCHTAEFDFACIAGRTIDPFFNANTPEDLAEADTLLEQSSEPAGEGH